VACFDDISATGPLDLCFKKSINPNEDVSDTTVKVGSDTGRITPTHILPAEDAVSI
jgi:hypothetical protein